MLRAGLRFWRSDGLPREFANLPVGQLGHITERGSGGALAQWSPATAAAARALIGPTQSLHGRTQVLGRLRVGRSKLNTRATAARGRRGQIARSPESAQLRGDWGT